ncbi:MAG: GntR family transcriptional regulator [Mangrovicoccus sp.]|nr:GntR family transcriptional regulator [Mangrovicoccus sp.]
MSASARSDMPRSSEIALGLARAIHGRRLAPGAKLGEDEIGEIYSVSRTVVRAALQQLAHQGLVEMKPNKGAFVSQPTPREAREVFEARAMLEPSLARAAAERASAHDIARLHAHMEAENAALAAQEAGEALRLSGLFHMEIARIADQQILAGFVEALVMRSSLVIALYAKRQSAVCECNAHLSLVEALAAHDGARAEELMITHLADLAGALDLSERAESAPKLKEILLGDD